MSNPRDEISRIEGSLDWFESNATGGGAESLPFREVADGIWAQDIQYGTGNALSIRTDDGVVQVDTGISADHARGMIENLRGVTDQPVSSIIYSHGHTAYNHGVVAWLDHCGARGESRPPVIGHRNVARRYDRYRETQRYLELVTEWQYGFPPGSIVGHGMFEVLVDPDVTYIDSMTLPVAGRRVELLHCHSETDDGTALWFPGEKLLYGANATVGSFPNIGSPLRSPRDPRAWADQLDAFADLHPEVLIREYGPEVVGRDNVADMLCTVRDALRWIRDQTLQRMNAGMVLEDVLDDIEFPAEFAESEWLPQSYGCPAYVIQDVWRIEAGWWDRNITSVHPAPASESAAAVLDAIADKAAVLDAARRHLESGEAQLALHVVDLLATSDADLPEVAEAKSLKSEIAAALAERSPTYMSTNYYRAVAAGFPAR